MAESALTPLSMCEQAIVRYLIAGHAGTVDDTYGSVRSIQKRAPNTIVWCEEAREEQIFTGNYIFTVHVMVKSALPLDQKTEGDDDPANAHEARSAAVYGLLKIDSITANGMPQLSEALSAQVKNFSVQQVQESETGMMREFEKDVVVDTYALKIFGCPSVVT